MQNDFYSLRKSGFWSAIINHIRYTGDNFVSYFEKLGYKLVNLEYFKENTNWLMWLHQCKGVVDMKKRVFRYDCINPTNACELEYIIDYMTEITCDTFKRNVDCVSLRTLKQQLGYTKTLYRDCGITLETDWSVQFFKSKLPDNSPVYILCHSGVEYVFY